MQQERIYGSKGLLLESYDDVFKKTIEIYSPLKFLIENLAFCDIIYRLYEFDTYFAILIV